MYERINEFLPLRICNTIKKTNIETGILEELRIRRDRQAYMVISGENVLLNIVANDEEMLYILKKVSRHSLYAFKDNISNGYITLDVGVRIGLVGKASVENGEIVGVYDISEFVIRFPNNIKINCSEILPLVNENSILIYSPPGEGKTTLLRSIIKELSKGRKAKRMGVIDTRGELSAFLDNKDLLVSILSGYPRKIGIEIAVRTMNSQIIVCDEIGDEKDASAIIDAQGAGIPIIATCHGSGIKDILSHTGIRRLHQARIFNYYVGIKRNRDFGFAYSVSSWEEANEYI